MSKLKDKFFDGLSAIKGQANKALTSGKIQVEILKHKNKIGSLQKEVGDLVYKQHIRELDHISLRAPVIYNLLKEIDTHYEKIRALESNVDEDF